MTILKNYLKNSIICGANLIILSAFFGEDSVISENSSNRPLSLI